MTDTAARATRYLTRLLNAVGTRSWTLWATRAEYALAQGADPDVASEHQQATVLHYATAQGLEELVASALACGANSNAEDRHGNTPLSWAMDAHPENRATIAIGERLLRAGALVTHCNHAGVRLADAAQHLPLQPSMMQEVMVRRAAVDEAEGLTDTLAAREAEMSVGRRPRL